MTRQEIRFLLTIFIDINFNHIYWTTFRKENMWQRHFNKPFEFHNFSEMFYCRMTMLRITNLGVFIQCQYTRTIQRNKHLGQSLFQNFNEIFYCGMARLRNTCIFGCFYSMSAQKNYFKTEKTGLSLLKKRKFKKFEER